MKTKIESPEHIQMTAENQPIGVVNKNVYLNHNINTLYARACELWENSVVTPVAFESN